MLIPNVQQAIIDPAKLRDYLLSASHPVGRYKAMFFQAMGYTQESWQQLDRDLREQHLILEAKTMNAHSFGTKYEIQGDLTGPSGKLVSIKSVWIVLTAEDFPRFVTAYPGKAP